jgi:hypothetical protein
MQYFKSILRINSNKTCVSTVSFAARATPHNIFEPCLDRLGRNRQVDSRSVGFPHMCSGCSPLAGRAKRINGSLL